MKIQFAGYLFLLILFSQSKINATSNYWQQQANYKMNVFLDVNTHKFNGETILEYTNNSPDTLNKVFFHLYFNAFQPNSMMDIRSRTIEDPDSRVKDRIFNLSPDQIGRLDVNNLKQNDKNVTYHTEGTVMEVKLNELILPGGTHFFTFEFMGQVPLQIRRSGRDNDEGVAYSMAQWFPKIAEYDKRGWHAHPYVGREFYSPWGRFEVNIEIDKKYVVAASGVLTNPEEIGYGYGQEVNHKKAKYKTLTYKFIAENVHDFMWAADPDYLHSKLEVTNGPTLHFFYQKDTVLKKNWEKLPELTAKAFQYMNENFGKYPYPVFNVIQGGDGGMEYPMSTLITGNRNMASLLGVTVHEAFHSWYQGVLATNESYFAWMDEGFTSYGTSVTVDHVLGTGNTFPHEGSYRGYFALAKSGKEEPLSTHADQFETNGAYGRAAYSKGAVTLAQLGYIIGENAVKKGLLRYFDEWKFKHPELNDFTRVMEKTSGLELDWYFDYWVNSTKTIDYGIDTIIESGTDQTTVELKRIGKMPMPIDMVIEYTDGTKELYYIPLGIMRGEKDPENAMPRIILKDWYWTHPSYSIAISKPFGMIKTIQIDPSKRMADIDRTNNLYKK